MTRLDTPTFIQRATAIHGDRYDYSQANYGGRHGPITIICRIHGAFSQHAGHHMTGSGCVRCNVGDIWTKEESDTVKTKYRSHGAPHCAEKLGRTIRAVQAEARRLGLMERRQMSPSHHAIPRFLWSTLLRNARTREIEVEITLEDVWSQYLRQDGKCALTGWPIMFSGKANTTASVDRVDSSLDYTVANIQIVHKHVNRSKWASPDSAFYAMCKAVHEHRSSDMEESVVDWEWDVWNDTVRPVTRRVLRSDA